MTRTSLERALAASGVDVRELLRLEPSAELVRIARELERRGCRDLGLLPAGDDVGVPAVAVRLAHAMSQVTGAASGVIDLLGTWMRSDPDPAPGAGDPGRADDLLARTALGDRVTLLRPATRAFEGWSAELLRAYLDEPQRPRSVVVDLTGLDHIGEHLDAIDALDGVAVVAAARATTTPQVERWMREIPAHRNLGVLLVGV